MNFQNQEADIIFGDGFELVEDQIADIMSVLQDTYHQCTSLHDELIAENWRTYVLGRMEGAVIHSDPKMQKQMEATRCFERPRTPTLEMITPRISEFIEKSHLEVLLENLNRGYEICQSMKDRINRFPECDDDGWLIFDIWYRMHRTLDEQCDFDWHYFRKRKAQIFDLKSKTRYD